MSSSSASSSGACPSHAPAGLPGGVKGDNPEGDQGGGNSSVNQPQPSQSVNQPQPSQSVNQPQPSQSVNQPQPSQSVNQTQPSQSVNQPQPSQSVNQQQPSQSVNQPQPSQSVNQPQPSQSVNKAYSYGPSSQRQAAGQMKDDGQEGGAQGDRKPSVSDFHNLDFSGHFKIKLLSRKDKPSVLKLKVNEEQFVKFRHLFHSELQLEALKQALLSDLKVAVTGDGYPPSICPQEGASHPIDISINRVLTSLCYQLKAVNISSTSWNTNQVKDTLSLLDSYQKGIVIGYDVSSDDTNCWLVGERGAIKTTMEALGQQLVPFRYQQTDQQEPNVKETTSDNRPTAQTRLDNKQTGQSGSDNNQTAQTGLDNRQTSQTDLDRQKRPSGVNADIERSGSENKPLEQVESNIRCLGLPESGDRQSGQSGSSQSETDNITGEQLAPNVMDTAQVLPGEPKDQIMDRSPDETDVHRTPFEYLPRGQGDRARGVNMSTSRTDDQSQPIDHPTRKEGDQPMTNFTATLELGRLPAKIWTSIQLMKDYEHKLKNIKLEDKSNGHCLHISGDKGTVDRVSTDIRNQLDQIERDRVDLSSVMRPEQMSMLRVSGVLDYVKDHIKRKGISCHLEQDKDTTRVYATQDYISDILKEIHVAIFCQEFEIDSKWRLFVHSPYVQQDIINLQKYYNDKVTITVTESLVIIVCTSDISEEVLKAVNKMKSDFSEAKAKTLPYIPHGHMTVELCAKVLHDQLNSAREKYGVEISPIRNKDKQGWIVKGPAGTLEEACEDVKKRTAKIVSKSVHLKDKVCKEFFESKPGQNEMVRVGEDTGTLVTINKKEVSVAEEKPSRSDITGSTTHRVASLTSRQWRLGDGSHITLYYGDGRTSPDKILVELKTGDPTSGVKLPPHDDKQYVVTLTIPEWKEGVNKEKDTIHKMFKEIITAAAERNVTCLTILLDSGWDGKKACKQLVKNTLYVLKHDNAVACSCTYFTGDQEKFKLIRNIIDESFNDDKSVTTKDKGEEIDDYEVIDGSDAERKPHLVKGELAKMTSEVIVNTTRTDLRLDQGAVSLSILKAAGQGIQYYCNQYYGGVKHGEIAVTRGYKLKCTYVFHGALPHYSTERMNRMEVMERFMRNCLKEADTKNCKTISFPALGTGNLGYPKDLVAHTMFDTVKKYFQEKPDSCVEGVNFVVYPKDRATVKAFEDEDRKPKGTDVAGATGGVDGQRDDTNNRSTGQPTGMTEETHLVVVSQTGDNMDKAIRQLQNKIIELQGQQSDRPPPPSPPPTPPPRRRKEQSGSKSPSPTSDTKDSASVVLIRTEYEKKRLIVTSKSHSALDKERIEDWLAKPTGIDVICPFRDETEALIIFTSMKDAQKMLDQHGNDAYLVAKFPKQTVQNVKAKLKSDIAQAIQTRVNGNAIYDASGATWLNDHGTCYLTGSLPEIQCAYKYIVSIITDGIRNDRFLDGRRPDDSGDPHGDTRGHDRLTKQGNQAQSRRPYGDATDGRENTTTATGRPTQSSQYDAEPEESDRSKNKVNACQTHVTSTKIKDSIQTKNRGHDNTIHIVKKHDDNESESSQQNDSRPSVNVGNLNGGNTRELTKEFFNPKQGSGIHDHYCKVQADPVNRDQRQQKVSKGHLAGEDMVEEGDKIDFDNMSERTFYSSEMEQGTLKKTGQHNQKWTYPDHVDERETLSCPSEQYIEIVYFNEGIGNGLEVECSTNRNECYITGQIQNFGDARDQHRQYARRQIKTLTDTELKKFEEYYQRQEHAMHSKGILCQHNPSHKEIKLVGKNSDAVGETERQILTVIGRVTSQPFQKQSKPDSGRKKRMTPPSGSEVWKSSGGIQVFMYQGDLLNLDVDVIVHGTNSELDNSRGLSAQISQAAGPELETACKTVYDERRLNVADACYTTAGNLHYTCVIHVVVPRWPKYKKIDTDQSTRRKLYHDDLGRAILNALDEACNIGAKSVALPAIGCAKCPSDIFPAAFGEALHCFLETDKVTPLRQIHVVDQSNQDILNKIKFELVRKSHSTDKQKSPEKFRDEAGAQHISGSKTHPSKWKKCSTTGRTCMLFPKLRVTIKEGKYIQTQASALVSIEDEDLQSARYVAKEIAKAAGDQYRKEMEQLRKKGIKYQISDVFDTYAGDIRNAKHVLHVIGPVADTDIVGNKDLFKALAGNIRACIFRVLNKVVEMELDSVALPSFTSGTFEQGQTEKVWELCVDVVKKYAADQSVKSSLKEIILVAGHHDVQLLLKLFESKMPHYGTVV